MKHYYLLQKVREFSRMAYRYNIDPIEVESEAMAELYNEPLSDMDNPEGFIFRAVRNTVIDLYRKEKRRATPVPEFYDNMVGGTYDRNEFDGLIPRVRQHVEEILNGIKDERRRTVASAYYIKGLPTRKIASILEMPTGTIKRLLYEARNELESDQLADVLVWDDFNRLETQYNNRNYGEGASDRLISILRDEGFLL